MFTFALILILLTVIFAYYKRAYQYWQRRNLPYLKTPILCGHLSNPFGTRENHGVTIQRYYNEAKRRNWKHAGLYFMLNPVYLVVDLDYVKNILTKDFEYFADRGFYYNERDDPISAHLFAITGAKWKNLRAKITPTFTPGKIKTLFQTLVDCESSLREKMLVEYKKQEPINIKEILARFTIDVIVSCAFGVESKTFEDENSPFRICTKQLVTVSTLRLARDTFAAEFPDLARKLGIPALPRDITDFFMKMITDTVNYRETNNYRRNDFVQMLIGLKNDKQIEKDKNKHDGSTLTIEELAAQCFVFFAAAFETSSTTMTFALYELAKNQEFQEKVREEIQTVLAKYDNKITYDSINDMKYMQQVIDETLRMYPPLLFLTRKCVKDYKIPDEDVIIEKGTRIMISILGIHYDKEYYPNPEIFDPERFTEKNKSSRHHYAHIPFGEGPRICVGMRFGLMQAKVGFTSLLNSYKFSVNEKTQEPLKIEVNSFVLAAKGDIWLDAKKL